MKIIGYAFFVAGLYAQAPQFEAATMKLLPPGEPGRGWTADASQFSCPGTSLFNLVREAYRLRGREQI
jgi:hypothetical protein